MKILIVVTSISRAGGGVAEVVRLSAAVLKRSQEIEVELVTYWDSGTADALSQYDGIRVHILHQIPPKRFGLSPGLLLLLLRSRPDIVHVHGVWQAHTAAVLVWSLLTRRPYVVSPHGMLESWILARSRLLKIIVSKLFHDKFLHRATCFQVLTQKEAYDVLAIVPAANCRVIPNYVPVEQDSLHEFPTWWQHSFDGRKLYLFFGRIHPKKGCLELLRAWDIACSDPQFRDRNILVFCGWNDGLMSFDSELEAIYKKHNNVKFGGDQFGDDKRRTFARATFLILPSYSEGLPMVVLEAWAAGLPVLMTSACNLSIGFSTNAACKIRNDIINLSIDLKKADNLSERELYQMQENARSLMRRNFSAEIVGDSLIRLYSEAVRCNALHNLVD